MATAMQREWRTGGTLIPLRSPQVLSGEQQSDWLLLPWMTWTAFFSVDSANKQHCPYAVGTHLQSGQVRDRNSLGRGSVHREKFQWRRDRVVVVHLCRQPGALPIFKNLVAGHLPATLLDVDGHHKLFEVSSVIHRLCCKTFCEILLCQDQPCYTDPVTTLQEHLC